LQKINLFLSSRVSTLENTKSGIILNDRFSCDMVINSSYSGLNTLKGSFKGVVTGLKHEITEMALVKMPEQLSGVGVTVMDGPFFSFMPFPAKDAFTLSHVRYTPHLSWIDDKEIDPYEILKNYHRETRYQRMIKDAARYLPIMHDAVFLESMFEIKTVLLKNEGDDGRPILFEKDQNIKGLYSVLGGKIDNIYDVIQQVDMILEGNV